MYNNFIFEATFSGLHVSLAYTVSQTAPSLAKATPKVLLNLLHSLILVCYYDQSNAECDTSCEEGKRRLYKPQFQAHLYCSEYPYKFTLEQESKKIVQQC